MLTMLATNKIIRLSSLLWKSCINIRKHTIALDVRIVIIIVLRITGINIQKAFWDSVS